MAAPIGNFQIELQKKSDALSKVVIDSLTKLKTEYYIFKKVSRLSSIEDISWISTFLDNCHDIHSKSNSKASLLRNEGNKYFQKKLYKEAIDKYTQAIFLADRNEDDLSLAYGNRSATLYRLQSYKECLIDITEAVRYKCPHRILHKLLLRKANCLLHLHHLDQVKLCLDEIRKSVPRCETELINSDVILQEVEDIEEKCSTIGSRASIEQVNVTPPRVSYGCSDTLVQASSAVCLQNTQEKGRYLVACKEIQPGDTLIVETPYAAVLLPEHYDTNCHHCFTKVKVTYPCRQCTMVKYCSPSCSVVSWEKYHHTECLYLPLLHSVGIAHLSLRVVLIAGLQFLIHFNKKQQTCGADDQLPGLDETGRYCHNYQTVYDLLTHVEHMDVKDIFQYTMTAQLLLTILQHADWFSTTNRKSSTENQFETASLCGNSDCLTTDLDTDIENNCTLTDQDTTYCNIAVKDMSEQCGKSKFMEKKSDCRECNDDVGDTVKDSTFITQTSVELCIGSLLLRHILQLVCNAHAITDLQCSQIEDHCKVEEKKQVRIATAIYPTASLMNHSCDPTVISSFNKDTLVVRATKHVAVGGEIFNCYGPHYRRMEYKQRQRCLKEQYFFTCDCVPCKSGENEEDLYNCYQCTSCSGPVTKRKNGVFICSMCKKESRIDSNTIGQMDSLFQTGYSLLQQNNLKEAQSVLLECYSLAKKILYKHSKKLSEITDCVARCYAMSGEFNSAAKYVTQCLDTVESLYGTESVEVGNELQKLSEILISAQQWQEALKVTDRACKIFELNYGRSHDTVRDLSSARKELKDVVKALC